MEESNFLKSRSSSPWRGNNYHASCYGHLGCQKN